jgi:hypothetical protein
MKRGLLGLFALTLAFGFACSSRPATSVTPGGSADAGVNTAGAACDRAPIHYSIVISLGTKPMKDAYYLSVAPYEVSISVKCKDQIRWIVSNPFKDVEVKDIQITRFKRSKAPYTDPFGSGSSRFEVKYVGPQRIGDVLSSIGVNYGEYDYEVSGTLTLPDGRSIPLTMDPRVVVGD